MIDHAADPDFRAIFEGLPGLYLVLDTGLHILAASDAYLAATLTRREEIVGRHLFEVFPENPDDPSADSIRNTRASLNRVLRDRVPDVMVVQRHDVRSGNGRFEVRYWSPINSPLLHEDGSIRYIIHRVENVTDFVTLKEQGSEQAKLISALREQPVRMEADLYARSREVAESSRRLKQANEELARLYEKTREMEVLKSRFFANVSHELRTPLSLILGPVRKRLAAGGLAGEERRDLEVVERNAVTLLKHVNDLLDLSKLEAGRMRAEYVAADFGRLSRLVASCFEPLAEERRIRFDLQLPASLPAQVDAEKIQRVLLNLLSNAFKVTPEGGSVRLAVREDAGTAVITVEDSGPGVPVESREAVFERFRQLDGPATARHGGTGLGLAIVKEFVALHGGEVRVADAPGGGAAFEVRLPTAAPAGADIGREADLDEEAGRHAANVLRGHVAREVMGSAPAGSPIVLVVEDNPEMNAFVAEALAESYRVARAFDGRQGLEQALSLQPT